MKNILSYKIGSVFTGKDINEWIEYQLINNTSHTKEARQLARRYIFIEDRQYEYIGNRAACGGRLFPWFKKFDNNKKI